VLHLALDSEREAGRSGHHRYVRTERRARAIENVLLPEIAWSLKYIDEQLEILDQEEIARVRQHR
jgi:V/A-type H+-transporting ATPase subunit D